MSEEGSLGAPIAAFVFRARAAANDLLASARCGMPDFHFRLSDDELAQLDRLTDAVRARYEHIALTIPRFAAVAADTTRSSALRDLLAAWDRGNADTAFTIDDREMER